MISKYSLVKAIPVASDPITLKRKSAAFSPNKVTIIEVTNAKIIDWAINNEALFIFFSPKRLPIDELVAAPIPTPTAIITKYIGNDLAIALIASAEILPANHVSTKL
jgi:hypothetical protein